MALVPIEDEYDPWPDIAETLRAAEAADDMGIQVLYVHGDEHFSHCPLPQHPGADVSPSFSFNDDKLVYNCFVCGGGNFVKLTEKLMEMDRESAINWLIGYSDYNAEDDDTFLKQVERLTSETLPGIRKRTEHTLPWFPMKRCEEWHELGVEHRAEWFEGRRIEPEVRDHLMLGWAPDLVTRVAGETYLGPAILIPHFIDGVVVGYQRRWEEDPRPDALGKYTNTPDFPREYTLYNQDMALKWKGPVIVVESPMTVARLLSAGLMAVATFGAKVTPEQIRILRRFTEVWSAYDNDEAGERATDILIEGLDEHLILDIVPPPKAEKSDLGDLDDDALIKQLNRRVPSILHQTAS